MTERIIIILVMIGIFVGFIAIACVFEYNQPTYIIYSNYHSCNDERLSINGYKVRDLEWYNIEKTDEGIDVIIHMEAE